MAAPVVLVLVAGNAVVEGDLAGQAAVGKELEGAVDGGEADAGIGALDQLVQFFGGKMLVGFEEGAQDGIALAGVLEADALEVPVEDLFGLADGFARKLPSGHRRVFEVSSWVASQWKKHTIGAGFALNSGPGIF